MKIYSSLTEKERFFTCYNVHEISELESILNRFQDKRMVFRGIKEACYYNYPSALVRIGTDKEQNVLDNLITSYIDSVRKNKRLIKLLKRQSKDCTDFQILSLLQHYGFGTTILDFSYRFNYAVFFALDGMSYTNNVEYDDIANYVSIYMFDSEDVEHCSIHDINARYLGVLEDCHNKAKKQYGEKYHGISKQTKNSYERLPYRQLAHDAIKGGISISGRYGGRMCIASPTTGIFVIYDISNDRNDAQYGLFKLSPSANKSYEECALDYYSSMNRHLFCINIHKSIADILHERYLKPYGISKATIYPKTKFYNKVIRELLKTPFMDESLVPSSKLVNLKECTYKKLRKNATRKLKRHKKKLGYN